MVAVWQKIKADILERPLIATLITLTIVAASTLLTLALATLMNLNAPYKKSFDELNAAHLWLYFDRDKVRQRDIARLETLAGVANTTGLRYSITSRVSLRDTRVWVSLQVLPPDIETDTTIVNRLLVKEGRYPNSKQEEVLASKDLNDLYRLSMNDTIEVTRWDGQKVRLPVIGLAFNPMWDTYRNTQPPYLYITEDLARKLFPDRSTWAWSLGLRLDDPEAVDTVLAAAKSMLRTDAVTLHTDWRDVQESAVFGAQLNFVFLGAFSLFAILAAILVITTSISSTVLSQFRQIGILKAIGFTQSQVLLLYLGQYLVLGVIGTGIGFTVGVILSPLPLRSVSASLSTPLQPPLNFVLIALVFSLVEGVIVTATLQAARRGAKANIVRAIATGSEAPPRKAFWIVRVVEKLGFPMPFVLALNDVFAKPFRSLMTGLNLMLGVVGIIFGLTLNETLDVYRETPALLGVVYDAVVTRELTSHRQTQSLLRRAPGVAAFYSESLIDVETLDGQEFQVRAVEGDLAAFPFRISEGRFFQPNSDETIVGRGLLNWLELETGDALTLILEDERHRPITWKIVGQYPEPVNAGQMMMVNWSSVERTVRPAQPRTYYVQLAPDANTAQLKRYLTPDVNSDLNLTIVGQSIPDVVVYLQLAIFALSAILIVIALVNVFNTSLLAVQEKLRIVGVLKTLGMTPTQVIVMVNTTAGVLGFFATVFGVPLGLLFTRGILAVLADVYGFGEAVVTSNVVYVVLMFPLMIIVSMMGSVIPGRRAARLSIVKVLRNE